MTHGSLFSGIGGFDLAASWMGWENKFHCEINKFCQQVLKKNFPEVILYEDIKTTDFSIWNRLIDVVSGGFPCQPYSVTGKRKGTEDDRHLWPAMLGAIKQIQPRWVIGENVHGIISWQRGLVLDQIRTDLEASGFEVFPPLILPAGAIGASHKRYRMFLVAHSNCERYKRFEPKISNEVRKVEVAAKTLATHKIKHYPDNELPKPIIISRTNGIPVNLDGITFSKWREGSISGFGNAVVPQVPYQIFKTIEKYENILAKT